MLNRWMNTGVIAIAIIILIGVTQVYAENAPTEKTVSDVAALDQLLHTADLVIEHADQWVIKWQGGGQGDARAQATKLAVELGLEAPVQVRQNEHNVYRSEGTVEASETVIDVLLNAAETDNDGYYVIVQLSGGAKVDRKTLLAMHGQIEEVMAESDLKVSWNMSVQGMLGAEDTSSMSARGVKKTTDGSLAAIEAKLSRKLNIMKVERYEDATTTSVSYQAADLPLEIPSGPHKLNMQLAVHQLSDKGDARVTVGFPVITIEY